eukprot:366481-Chlamydomonas_euryale.AAC.1
MRFVSSERHAVVFVELTFRERRCNSDGAEHARCIKQCMLRRVRSAVRLAKVRRHSRCWQAPQLFRGHLARNEGCGDLSAHASFHHYAPARNSTRQS